MKLHDYLTSSVIYTGLSVADKEELFATIVQRSVKQLATESNDLTAEKVLEVVKEREALISTGVGGGIAVPHARMPGVEDVFVAIATLAEPVDYNATDNLPVELIALILIPESQPAKGLKVMAQLARLFSTKKSELLNATGAEEVLALIAKENLSVEEPILARDIMSEIPFSVYPESPLRDVTKQMESYHINGIPVVDHENHLVGEITCGNLFNIGIPEFFKSLKSVSFVSYFDPFEVYFDQEAHSTAGDIMMKVDVPLEPTTTILEIVYQLVVKNRPVLYVVDEGKLVGLINPNTVLNRIINS